MNSVLVLTGLSGICWTIVYIECIRLGFKQKTFGMPFWALTLNIAWEALHTVLGYKEKGLSLQIVINAIWFVFDIGILYTYFKYGQKSFPDFFSKNIFIIWSVLGLVVSFFIQYFFVEEFGRSKAAVYSAFLQNLMMSILFIAMYVQRRGNEGQNLTIAISKFIGTALPTIVWGIIGTHHFGKPNMFVLCLGVFIALFDVIYIGLLLRKKE